MSAPVVVALEMIQIDHRDAQRIVHSLRARKLDRQRIFEAASIDRTGQRVLVRQLVELAKPLAVRDSVRSASATRAIAALSVSTATATNP